MLPCGDTWFQSKGRRVRNITVMNVLRDRKKQRGWRAQVVFEQNVTTGRPQPFH